MASDRQATNQQDTITRLTAELEQAETELVAAIAENETMVKRLRFQTNAARKGEPKCKPKP